MRLGGLGLRSATRHRHAAYWASWVDVLHMIRQRSDNVAAQFVAELARGLAAGAQSIREAAACRELLLSEELQECPTWQQAAQGVRPPTPEEAELGEWAHGWQYYGSDARDKWARDHHIFPHLDSGSKSLLRSQSGPCSGTAFSTTPTSDLTRVPPHEFRVLLLRRLRLDLPFCPQRCRCGHRFDVRGDHRSACPRAG
eukprot:56750-Karenia_brevis.AAC.1